MPAKIKLTIYSGSDFSFPLVWEAAGVRVDLTGFTGRMQIRDRVDGNVMIECTTENGRILLEETVMVTAAVPAGSTDGVIRIRIPAAVTESFDSTITEGVYDLELESSGGIVTRVIYGAVVFVPEVTKD
jgi:hypothetical protein